MGEKGGRYHLLTFGCQMNKYDSEKIEGLLAREGMTATAIPEEADLILLNTCSIRDKAEHKVFSKLGILSAAKRADQLIAVGGCMASLRKEDIFRRAPMVDVVFGPDAIERLPKMVGDFRASRTRQIDVAFDDAAAWDRPEGGARESDVVAWVGIMKGCDNRCSYCVVPDTRGPEVSRPADSILAEVEGLAAKGYKGINLLGQNVNSYGKGLAESIDFPGLLRMVDKVEGVERIRFMTSHPKDLNDGLIASMVECKKAAPSFHLPLQAGSDRILGLMRRGYTAAGYLEKIRRLRAAAPHITVSADIMVGFPGETEDEFLDTIRVMEEVRFDSLFLFNYSPRPGTPSAEWQDVVPRAVSQERFDRAMLLQRKIVAQNNALLVGTVQQVLCEGAAQRPGAVFGRTPGNHLVVFEGYPSLAGRTLPVTITSFSGYNLAGTMVCGE